MPTQQPDRELIRGFLEGSAECHTQIDTWLGQVLGHPGLRLGNDVEDVAQQVRRKLLTSLRDGRFREAASLRTYVWRVAQHAAIDHLRHRRTQPLPLSIDDVADPPDPGITPERDLLERERRALFALVLGRLEEPCRELLSLIVFDQLSYAEIARRLQTTEGAIKVRALRCREKAVLVYKAVTSSRGGRPSQEEAK